MNETIENKEILPPAFMATTRQKILLQDHQVQEYALDYPEISPVVSLFESIGNIAINLFEKMVKAEEEEEV